jgi:spore photoproduct lyase
VDDILDLPHNGHTIIAWSMNNALVSQKYEIGAPSFEERLTAAQKVQEAGYRVRVRLDPIVPFRGSQEAYAETVRSIFERISPESVTLGTLRFEEGFFRMRNVLFSKSSDLCGLVAGMEPMFPPKMFPGSKKAKSGKYSFSEEKRLEIFDFIINQVRKYSNCPIALCKESATVWDKVGLPLGQCSCACQLYPIDMVAKRG